MRFSRLLYCLFLCVPILLSAQKSGQGLEELPGSDEPNTYEKLSIPITNTSDVQYLVNILKKNYKILENNDINLVQASNIQSLGGIHCQFTETYKGIPIYNAGIKINIHNNVIISALNSLKIIPTNTNFNFSFSKSEAIQNISALINPYSISCESHIHFFNNNWVPVYVLETFSHQVPANYEWIVHAQTGKVLQKKDKASYHHIETHKRASFSRNIAPDNPTQSSQTVADNQRGIIFNPDPCTAANTVYGSPFMDNNDQNSPNFSNVMDTIDLLGLTKNPLTGYYSLEGPYVTIDDLEAPNYPPATSNTGNFFYNRSQSEFEDVMVYYHIDHYQRYIQSLGFTGFAHQISADPHGLATDNSYFIQQGGTCYLFYGTGGIDDAEDADVIVHEYGHALSYWGSPNTNSGDQRNGLDEGIGDYIAASYSYDQNPYNWDRLYNWDGNTADWTGRLASTSDNYVPTLTARYQVGTIWTATLMSIRQALGSEVADKLFFQELFHNAANMTLSDAANCYLDADMMLYQGAHKSVILQYFCNRNLKTGNVCITEIEPNASEGNSLNFTLSPNPSNGELSVKMEKSFKNTKLIAYNIMGEEVVNIPIQNEQSIVLPLAKGIYFVRLLTDDILSDVQKLIVE